MSYEDLQGVRLPDAVTIKEGPIQEVAAFLLLADQTARDRGIRLRVRRDIDALVDLNRRETAAGNWYPLLQVFDPAYQRLDDSNCYWISGVNEAGETVVAQAGRLFDWRGTNFLERFDEVLYAGIPSHPPYEITCPTAAGVSGIVCYSGSTWFHPRYRRLGLSRILPRTSRVFAYSQWQTDWTISLVKREQVEMNIATAYGYSDIQYGVKVPGHPRYGDLDFALVRMSKSELLGDVKRFTAERLALRRQVA